ncbi:hypothetical protein XM38_007960 [Halomicronema hongdechloris C2206]|uniref:Uncharacterized protein n=1 Tax=Halomicronema hongdechloris C2206 TaxID=1641165 RepID=A0A1Z3HHU6_9CYAN|nr:hypothetical protein [Halomicronema hongdechloris]ASC69866.1 hypothetical protein XM38_007960 [Halomicronema hongdechloris C2206]
MGWQAYGLDREAQWLVLQALDIDNDKDIKGDACLRESYKMRESVAYGLERFWGEHMRHQGKQEKKSRYWKATWDILANILGPADVTLPNDSDPKAMAQKLWGEIPVDSSGKMLTLEDQRLALAVLTQLCDCLVWWTQRYK